MGGGLVTETRRAGSPRSSERELPAPVDQACADDWLDALAGALVLAVAAALAGADCVDVVMLGVAVVPLMLIDTLTRKGSHAAAGAAAGAGAGAAAGFGGLDRE